MRSLLIVLVLSGIALPAFSQLKTKKYLKANKVPEKVIYPEHKSHSRALLVDGNKLLTGSADGSIYLIHLEKETQQLLFQQAGMKEIRDIEKTEDGYIAMQSSENSRIILIYKNGDLKILKDSLFHNVFLDGIDVRNNTGFLMGDPSNGIFNLYLTTNGGKEWQRTAGNIRSMADEAGYAASGTNVQMINDSTLVFVSGGMTSRFFISYDLGQNWKERVLPYYPGKSSGPYSICFANDSIGMMVGGDYRDKDLKLNTCFYTPDGGESWLLPSNTTRGYRSCVIHHNGVFYSCGTNGIDVSINNGEDWAAFADGNYLSLAVWNTFLIASEANGQLHFYNIVESK